jgi:hypothetical protein
MNNKQLTLGASLVGFIGLYPVLVAFARVYLPLRLPMNDNVDFSALLLGPLLLLPCGGFLLVAGRGLFRVLGAFYLLAMVWWAWAIMTTE